MKRLSVMVVVLVLVGAASLHAQHQFNLTVPFEFIAAGATLPAGDYLIRLDPVGVTLIIGQQGQGSVWALGATTSREVIAEVVTNWQPGPTGGNAGIQKRQDTGSSGGGRFAENSVVFNKYGNKCFLREIWLGHTGRRMLMSKTERAIRTAGIEKPQRLELATFLAR